MCTVSIVRGSSGFRMVFNRDELRTRPEALPPQLHPRIRTTAVWPVDAKSGGTWVAASDAGMVFALLNRTCAGVRLTQPAAVSRGTIIPQLSDSTSLAEAIERVLTIRLTDMAPFTLVVVDGSSFGTITSLDGRMSVRTAPLRSPVLFTSSSLGDEAVQRPRSELFEMLVTGSRDPLEGQGAFHRHRWPCRPEISVEMSRPDASTVSRTVVDVLPNGFALRYTRIHR